MTPSSDRNVTLGVTLATAAFVVATLHFSGGYYALAAGLTGAVLAAVAAGALALGFTPSRPAVLAAGALVVLGCWSVVSTAWGGNPHASWRFLGLALTAAAAIVVGSALAAHAQALAVGVLVGITAHAVVVLGTVGIGSAPTDWFDIRSLEGPIGYHNGEATMCAVGLPLALWVGTSSLRWARAAGAASAVLLVAVALLTQSRGSLLTIVAAVVVQLAVARRPRLTALALLLVPVAIALFLSLRAVDRALVSGRPLDDPAFSRYVALALALALAAGALSLPTWPRLRLQPRHARALLAAAGAAALAGVVVASLVLVPRIADLGDRLIAEPNSPSQVAAGDTRLSSVSPSGRIGLWRVALTMTSEKPLAGAGTGSFARRWSVERTDLNSYVLQAHSLELEILSDVGVVGSAALAAAIGGIAWGLARYVRRNKAIGAALTGSLAVFFLVSSFDWVHSFAALIAPVFLLAGAVAGPGGRRVPSTLRTLAYVGALLVTLGVLAGPAMAQLQLDRARNQADTSLDRAWSTAAVARSWDRWDPDVVEFQGLVAEREGRFEAAADLYRRASELSQQPWANTFREARALRRAGFVERSREACRRAIASNPLEPALKLGVCGDS